jgi:hypothetical protein
MRARRVIPLLVVLVLVLAGSRSSRRLEALVAKLTSR